MKSDLDVKITLLSGIGIFMLVLLLSQQFTIKEVWGAMTTAASVTAFGRFLILKWIWKWVPFFRRLHGVPYLEGTWSGEFISTWSANPGDALTRGPIEVRITQPDIFTVKVALQSGESISYSTTESFDTLEDGSVYLNYSYRNEPGARVRSRSAISHGNTRLLLAEGSGMRMSGNYFTDRKTTGEITITRNPN
ncbi:MAG: hypothetical protein JST04_08920 [Bdellovibrionales bacterium]|nr:hypothetical protein [Bdellovibrionales bacterium]